MAASGKTARQKRRAQQGWVEWCKEELGGTTTRQTVRDSKRDIVQTKRELARYIK